MTPKDGDNFHTLATATAVASQGAPLVAPRRFKSAFIMFSSMRHKEIKKELAEKGMAKKVRRSFVWLFLQKRDHSVARIVLLLRGVVVTVFFSEMAPMRNNVVAITWIF